MDSLTCPSCLPGLCLALYLEQNCHTMPRVGVCHWPVTCPHPAKRPGATSPAGSGKCSRRTEQTAQHQSPGHNRLTFSFLPREDGASETEQHGASHLKPRNRAGVMRPTGPSDGNLLKPAQRERTRNSSNYKSRERAGPGDVTAPALRLLRPPLGSTHAQLACGGRWGTGPQTASGSPHPQLSKCRRYSFSHPPSAYQPQEGP